MEMDVLVIMAGHIGYRRSPVLYGSDFSRQFVGNKQSYRLFSSEKIRHFCVVNKSSTSKEKNLCNELHYLCSMSIKV